MPKMTDEVYRRDTYAGFDTTVRMTDGFVNATRLCASALDHRGRCMTFRKWESTRQARKLKADLSQELGLRADALTDRVKSETDISGTYVHPALVPHIAAWASRAFAMRVSEIVNSEMTREPRVAETRCSDPIIDKLDRISDKLEIANIIATETRAHLLELENKKK